MNFDKIKCNLEKNGYTVSLFETKNDAASYLEEKIKGRDVDELAYIFHASLSKMIYECVKRISNEMKINSIAFSGGVFQNLLLMYLCETDCKEFKLYKHSLIPPNDGGIGLGQAVYAMYYLERE